MGPLWIWWCFFNKAFGKRWVITVKPSGRIATRANRYVVHAIAWTVVAPEMEKISARPREKSSSTFMPSARYSFLLPLFIFLTDALVGFFSLIVYFFFSIKFFFFFFF